MKYSPLVLPVLFLAACSLVDEREPTTQFAVQYAALKVIDDDPERADRVETIAREVKAYASGEVALTVSALIGEINERIDRSKLDTADSRLVDLLLLRLQSQLTERFGGDLVPEDMRVTVDIVADWVIEAAQLI